LAPAWGLTAQTETPAAAAADTRSS
jgi:hypothetical protein